MLWYLTDTTLVCKHLCVLLFFCDPVLTSKSRGNAFLSSSFFVTHKGYFSDQFCKIQSKVLISCGFTQFFTLTRTYLPLHFMSTTYLPNSNFFRCLPNSVLICLRVLFVFVFLYFYSLFKLTPTLEFTVRTETAAGPQFMELVPGTARSLCGKLLGIDLSS